MEGMDIQRGQEKEEGSGQTGRAWKRTSFCLSLAAAAIAAQLLILPAAEVKVRLHPRSIVLQSQASQSMNQATPIDNHQANESGAARQDNMIHQTASLELTSSPLASTGHTHHMHVSTAPGQDRMTNHTISKEPTSVSPTPTEHTSGPDRMAHQTASLQPSSHNHHMNVSVATGQDRLAPQVSDETLAALLKPGKCAADFISPPCDPFKMIDFDAQKFKDNSAKVPGIEAGYKRFTFGIEHGKLWVAYGDPKQARDFNSASQLVNILYDLAKEVRLETRFFAFFNDVPLDLDKRTYDPDRTSKKCKGPVGFHSILDPTSCLWSLPWNVRPRYVEIKDAYGYENKTNRAFWAGSEWPCGRVAHGECSRRVMVDASKKKPHVIWASFGKPLSFAEQFQFRFLMTSSPPHTYTGRLALFLRSNSVVVKFGPGWELAAQPAYAAMQDGVHLKLLSKRSKSSASSLLQELEHLEAAWEYLAPLTENAKSTMKWLDSPLSSVCYMF